MIRLQQLKLIISHDEKQLKDEIYHKLKLNKNTHFDFKIVKRSIDARKKPELYFNYIIDVDLHDEKSEKNIIRKLRKNDIVFSKEVPYVFSVTGSKPVENRPVVVGSGPAGLFCALMLARAGFKPLLIERGAPVDKRSILVNKFWEDGVLDPEVNVQFGEGGAGTFSDGKLNTLVKDVSSRNKVVLSEFVKAGAKEEILYMNKPHIGTDELRKIVVNIRNEINSLGGEVRFYSKLTDFQIKDDCIKKICINNNEWIEVSHVVLAIGHSARDTFKMIKDKNIVMQQKAFAIGVRIEHPQKMINLSQYGSESVKQLGAADYKLTAKDVSGRGVFSFCMCPGGYVVNASSEEESLAVNGMSYAARDSANANSAILVTVNEKDFGSDDVLAGVALQRKLEKKAFAAGEGNVPIQLYGDYFKNVESSCFGDFETCMRGKYAFGNVRDIFPEEIGNAIANGIAQFDRKIKGYARYDAIMSGVESRSSSPVRIVRGDDMQSLNIKGLYPCGEGAGYAGGITSAAMDGIKVAEAIAKEYKVV